MLGSLMMLASGVRGQLAELGERVADALVVGAGARGTARGCGPAREMSRVSTSTPAWRGVRLDDRQERVRRQQRRLVGVRVDDRDFSVRHGAN